jgi:hypothetical protein
MSTSKKVIQIKPELFKMQKTKTLKASKKATAPIDTSKIKEQLTANILKRRRQKMKQEMEHEKKREESEFDKSYNFMLEEKEKEREVKEKNLRRSIKNHSTHATSPTQLPAVVNVEWPTDGASSSAPINAPWDDRELEEVPIDNISDSMLSYKLDKDINYGCLKGGMKKTYKNLSDRHHNRTISAGRVQFNSELIHQPHQPHPPQPPQPPQPPPTIVVPVAPLATPILAPTNIPVNISTFENDEPSFVMNQSAGSVSNMSIMPHHSPLSHPHPTHQLQNTITADIQNLEPTYIPPLITMHTPPATVPAEITAESIAPMQIEELKEIVKVPSIKETTKRKTIKHRYKLGKNKTLNNRISVLSTSKSRIKQIQDAKRELQKTSIEKMKTYLMDRNLLSPGSFAQPELIKKLYEEANLAADITNHNDEKLLENYLDSH